MEERAEPHRVEDGPVVVHRVRAQKRQLLVAAPVLEASHLFQQLLAKRGLKHVEYEDAGMNLAIDAARKMVFCG
jgi:hypothetical protein